MQPNLSVSAKNWLLAAKAAILPSEMGDVTERGAKDATPLERSSNWLRCAQFARV